MQYAVINYLLPRILAPLSTKANLINFKLSHNSKWLYPHGYSKSLNRIGISVENQKLINI